MCESMCVIFNVVLMVIIHRHLSEVMLREIAHVPGPELEFADDRESYSLSAGIALGMTTLGVRPCTYRRFYIP